MLIWFPFLESDPSAAGNNNELDSLHAKLIKFTFSIIDL